MTNEKTFEEQFPSLHLKTWIIGLETDVKTGTIYGQRSFLKGDDSGKYVKKVDIEKHCLDKQQVREVIINVCGETGDGDFYIPLIEKIFERLGL